MNALRPPDVYYVCTPFTKCGEVSHLQNTRFISFVLHKLPSSCAIILRNGKRARERVLLSAKTLTKVVISFHLSVHLHVLTIVLHVRETLLFYCTAIGLEIEIKMLCFFLQSYILLFYIKQYKKTCCKMLKLICTNNRFVNLFGLPFIVRSLIYACVLWNTIMISPGSRFCENVCMSQCVHVSSQDNDHCLPTKSNLSDRSHAHARIFVLNTYPTSKLHILYLALWIGFLNNVTLCYSAGTIAFVRMFFYYVDFIAFFEHVVIRKICRQRHSHTSNL